MDNSKFLFVSCVNNEQLYLTCLKHIQELNIPSGFKVELLPIRGVTSIAEGYNQALNNNAKYKIYLHQDTFILNKDFLFEILSLFKLNPNLGLLGTIGCQGVPSTGHWLEGRDLFGKLKLFNGVEDEWFFNEIDQDFVSVDLIDGYLMVTQYDIPWRSDLFHGFHCYDCSQSLEFKKKGFLVGIPKQVHSWSKHYMNHGINSTEWTYYQQIFKLHYKEFIDIWIEK
jgi:hypothetical protein